VSAWGSVGRTTCEAARPRSLLANVGHSWIVLPENVTSRGPIIPRPAQDAHPDGRIGAPSVRMACTAEAARARRRNLGPEEGLA
jgi:hypothetical protein